MPPSRCALLAEILPLSPALPPDEAQAIRDRILRRARLACQAHHATLHDHPQQLHAVFPDPDAALDALLDLHQRIDELPPPAGQPIRLRLALHAAPSADDTALIPTAARLLPLAQPGQTLTTPTVAHHARRNAFHCSPYPDQPGLYILTPHAPQGTHTMPTRLELHYQDLVLYVDDHHPILLLGRERGNDLVINNTRTSRQHARIEWRKGSYIITDHSTNGTWLLLEGGSAVPRKISHDSAELVGRGSIGCGWTPTDADHPPITYRISEQ